MSTELSASCSIFARAPSGFRSFRLFHHSDTIHASATPERALFSLMLTSKTKDRGTLSESVSFSYFWFLSFSLLHLSPLSHFTPLRYPSPIALPSRLALLCLPHPFPSNRPSPDPPTFSMKRLIILCDGTLEDADAEPSTQLYTNIGRLSRAIKEMDHSSSATGTNGGEPVEQIKMYLGGVGSEDSKVGGLVSVSFSDPFQRVRIWLIGFEEFRVHSVWESWS